VLRLKVTSSFLGLAKATPLQVEKYLKGLETTPLGSEWKEVKSNIHKRTTGGFLNRTIKNLLAQYEAVVTTSSQLSVAELHSLTIGWQCTLGQAKSRGEISDYELHTFSIDSKLVAALYLEFMEADYRWEKPTAAVLIHQGATVFDLF
jgi:hypothetical protein